MRKPLIGGLLALGLSLSAVAAPAVAAPVDTTSTVYKEVVAHLQADGVPEKQQEALAQKVLAGDKLDSGIPEKEPVKTQKWEDSKTEYVRESFADGSYRLMSFEKGFKAIPGVAVPAGISGCIVTTGTGYQSNTNCRVSESQATFQASFTASYTFSGGVYGSISKATNGNVKGIGGVASSISTKVEKSRSDGRIPASAYVKWNYKAAGDIAGGTTYLYLKVTPKTAYTVVD